jgi:hypothetical protein
MPAGSTFAFCAPQRLGANRARLLGVRALNEAAQPDLASDR